MSDPDLDVVVIGGGPGGYVAAIRAAQLGLAVACVESRGRLGGTCLNVGCIPSKALLQSSEHLLHARQGLAAHGVKVEKVSLDLAAMMARKEKVVADNVRGVEFLFRKNKVRYVVGSGRLAAAGEVRVKAADGVESVLKARHIVIATGSESAPLAGVEVDEKRIVSSTGALSLARVPKRLVVIGAGYIGLELGSVWRRLGAEVTVVEFLERVLPAMDGEVSKHAQRILARQGLAFRLASKVTAARPGKDGVALEIEPAKGGKAETLAADVVLVAVGRRPFTRGLGFDGVGVKTDNAGRVAVDERFRSSVAGIHAIGDVIRGPMLAHKAEDEGVAVAELIAGKAGHVNYDAIPGVVYTAPEIAAVGRTEEELKAAGTAYKAGKFPFSANARARVIGDGEGFVKILADAASDRVLGVHIVGPDAGTLIAEAALAMEYGASAEDLARTCHAHPTLSEAVKEAALAVAGRAIHI
ncbi:MAG: dihydrolipoyl dehydrogenase [Proteobacteria bacterium]|nr:dihydrolipoyl dehydrogenase [Pseudomonadota bacterium]